MGKKAKHTLVNQILVYLQSSSGHKKAQCNMWESHEALPLDMTENFY